MGGAGVDPPSSPAVGATQEAQTIPHHDVPNPTIPYYTLPYHTKPYYTIPYLVKGGGRRSTQQRPGKEEPLVGMEEGGDKEMLTIKESELIHMGI